MLSIEIPDSYFNNSVVAEKVATHGILMNDLGMPMNRATKARALVHLSIIAAAAMACTVLASPVLADAQTYITSFTKDNNIYTNLNEEFPNTGPGVPGSEVGTADASTLFTPTLISNGVSFDITSNSTGQDFEQIGAPAGAASLPVAIGVNSVSSVYALMGAYDGTSFNVTFTGANGATETFNNIALPDFNGGSINNCPGNPCAQTAFKVTDVGAGGTGNSTTGAYNTYDLTEVSFSLDAALAGQKLTSATFTSNGYETLLIGVTTVSAVPEPSDYALVLAGLGGLVFTLRRRGVAGRLAQPFL